LCAKNDQGLSVVIFSRFPLLFKYKSAKINNNSVLIFDMDLSSYSIAPEIREALYLRKPILAMESTILAHGMPFPQNVEFALDAQRLVRQAGALPAIIAILNGKICVGLNETQLSRITGGKDVQKTSVRDIPFVLASGASGATTVSSTMRVAHGVGIDVFSTGGIGGVHRGWETTSDVSQDLHELSRTPVLVVSAGAKAILDIPKTVERLESLSVPVVGYKTNDFPAFYSRKSGIKIDHRFDDIKLLANGFVKHRSLGFSSGMLVVNPPPKENEIGNKVVSGYIENALRRAKELGVSGKNLTPFLLHEVYKESNGESLKTNIALALSNIKLGAEIAVELKNV